MKSDAGRRVEHAIFFRQPVAKAHRHHGHRGHAGQLLQLLGRGRQQRRVAAEFVQHEAGDARAVFRRQQRPGAVQVREGAAAVDVGHQQAARVGVARHAQVDHVAGHQIDLGRRARAFDHHHVVLGPQRVQRGGDLRPHALAAAAPGQRRQLRADLAQQHHLAVRVGLGLEQQRVHAHVRPRARRQRLEVLRGADLAKPAGGRGARAAAGPPQGGERPRGGQRSRRSRGAWGHRSFGERPPRGQRSKRSRGAWGRRSFGERPLGGQRTTHSGERGGHDHPCVVAHVLRLEGRNFQALVGVVAAQRGRQPALAGAAAGAQHHDAARRHVGVRGAGSGRTMRSMMRPSADAASPHRPVCTGEVWMMLLRRAVSQ